MSAKRLFFALVVRPFLLVVTGFNVRHAERLPREGPALVVANHNSHLDTVVLMSLLPARLLDRIRPAAAADYFLKSGPLAWFSRNLIGIIPVTRGGRGAGEDPLAPVSAAIEAGSIVIFFPEGTRGEPERFKEIKSGIFHLSRRHPGVPIVPVFLHGLGKALPKGAFLPVPFFCDVFVGEPLEEAAEKEAFLAGLKARFEALRAEGTFPEWE
ncbi:MAG TPA: lysophospholipid acyltransferase family protein [Vicinamibacteria bacterium]|nr:lysophospholipid acyltransferase family protein [Vicinamibacteria bacterium]